MDDSSGFQRSQRDQAEWNRPSERAEATTRSLLDRAQAGDEYALEEIFERYLPRLLRWASGRLPRMARDIVDTDDLVQDTLLKVIRTLGSIRNRHPGTFPAYVRRAILNRLNDEARRASRRPQITAYDGSEPAPMPSPLEESIGKELADRYEAALERLSDDDRATLFFRIEIGMTYGEIAEALDKPSTDAARMAVNRAGIRLAREMHDVRQS